MYCILLLHVDMINEWIFCIEEGLGPKCLWKNKGSKNNFYSTPWGILQKSYMDNICIDTFFFQYTIENILKHHDIFLKLILYHKSTQNVCWLSPFVYFCVDCLPSFTSVLIVSLCLLVQDYNNILMDLSDLQREDRERRQRVVANIPVRFSRVYIYIVWKYFISVWSNFN